MNRTLWFARHELRLAWRDVFWMITAGRPRRAGVALVVIAGGVALLHAVAWSLVASQAGITFPPDPGTLLGVSGCAFLAWTLMVSQAMESVTRAFYARSDLDLLMSSPAPVRSIFMLRIAAVWTATAGLALVLIGPFVNVLVLAGGIRWMAAYGVLLALAATATALAVGLTVLLFDALGPRRTRFIAQVVAAVVGAVFVIGVQAVSVLAYGSLSRLDAFHSAWAIAMAPPLDSVFWLPARAAMGDLGALGAVALSAALLFSLALLTASKRFGAFAMAAAGIGLGRARARARKVFRPSSVAAALRRKEWTLLLRDPWLASQTLMQILYLIPPALLLWRNYGGANGSLVVLVPVLVMAAGQLAGGLAWLAISGEDAPDLVQTAPLRWNAVLRAKVEAVIGAVMLVLTPFALALALLAPVLALVVVAGALAAAGGATAIQILFRAQAKRGHFRRRQTSSRLATVAEALSSIGWAATAGLAAAGSAGAALTAAASLAVVFLTAAFRPAPAS